MFTFYTVFPIEILIFRINSKTQSINPMPSENSLTSYEMSNSIYMLNTLEILSVLNFNSSFYSWFNNLKFILKRFILNQTINL